jgi:hypothetical protein
MQICDFTAWLRFASKSIVYILMERLVRYASGQGFAPLLPHQLFPEFMASLRAGRTAFGKNILQMAARQISQNLKYCRGCGRPCFLKTPGLIIKTGLVCPLDAGPHPLRLISTIK